MKQRLIELLTDTLHEWECDAQPETVSQIAEHLMENGVFVLPFSVGDKVFFTHHISKAIPDFTSSDVVTKIGFATRGIMHEEAYDVHQIGKTVFPTHEEAERALKERDKNATKR